MRVQATTRSIERPPLQFDYNTASCVADHDEESVSNEVKAPARFVTEALTGVTRFK